MTYTNLALSQSDDKHISIDDLKEVHKVFQDREILKELNASKDKTIAELEKALALEKKNNELNAREIELQNRIIAIKDMEIGATRRALKDMETVAEKSLKLAETSKPKSNWQLMGLIGAVVFVAGMVIGGL